MSCGDLPLCDHGPTDSCTEGKKCATCGGSDNIYCICRSNSWECGQGGFPKPADLGGDAGDE